jgi:CBS domain containing-hemolysin-like protein
MRPASDMVYLDLSESEEENLALIDKHQFSRYPVCDGDRDNVMGLAHVKDVYRLLRQNRPLKEIKSELRDTQLIHRETPATELLAMFRGGHPHFAIVDDDLGQVVGFVTLDHLFEALVGQIQDEFEHSKLRWRELDDGSFIGSGALPLYSLERLMDIEIENDDVDSVGGLVMWQLDRVPRKGDRARFSDFDIVVREMRGPRIGRVQVFPRSPQAMGKD